MKLPAPDIGHAGMEQQLNNFALVVCCTTKMHTAVTGPKMLMDVKNIVSLTKLIIDLKYFSFIFYS
jgi:hypothetical protein